MLAEEIYETELTEPQTEFFCSDSKYTAVVAGFGSGKTLGAAVKLLNTKIKYPTVDLAYLAPTYPLIRDIFYPTIEGLLTDLGWSYKINKSENVIYIQGMGNIFCRTMERPELIVGWQVGDAYVDEFDVLPTRKAKTAMQKITARCRKEFPDGKKNQLFFSTTPEGFKATYEYFKKEPLEDSRLIHMSTYSNAHNLPDDYISTLIAQYPSQLIKAYIDGYFVNLTSGSVYYSFDREECNSTYLLRPKEVLHVGMDFNVYKMAAVFFIVRDGKMHVVDEVIDLRDTPDMIDHIKERFDGHKIIAYPDASGKNKSSKGSTLSDHKLLKEAGIQIKAKKANPLVRDRVASVNRSLENGNLKINVERCPFLTEALEQQVYSNNEPEKENELEHRLDALGYPTIFLFPVVKHIIQEKIIRGL